MLSWCLSNTMDADFCIQALEAAIQDHDCPQIFNTDQGAQFISRSMDCCFEESRYPGQHGW
ncbi:MAG: transposase family protein, partial [Pseudomonadota bacterium]